MLNIINHIDNEINSLKGSNYELRIKLNLLKKIALFLSQNTIQGKIDKIVPIIEMNTGYSEYRIINDCESDNKELWIEYIYEDNRIRLYPGDLLVKMK
ncbi:hypothetical protein [Snodgrassella alvi]|uniref:Uncharacterized protein n=1 Tax=Snodgrassella alvi TaxID=1196083 RepID=A0ABD7Z1R7_9NEIS|nr:hypothetical protein [Snodgrassella alvi]ORF07058.1 hypothetical protein BGH96_01080 [Snodgrassella alvi]PIT44622.1 hypothetical protein BHC45_07070 [Snodgrassella alvi]UOO99669.1 hypothetical protein LVJ87_05585 [Snodgrassella alvi wkB2]WLS98463.1 hypothetical protein RAM05_00120 [Snodgrassella alvi]